MIAVAPTVNSYKRYWDAGQFAPNLANWGLDSRAAAVRISSNGRMEFRIPDASVNPFLSHIFILASIADGLERGIDPGPAFGEESGDSIPRLLPTTLGDAIEAFRSDAYLQSVIPESLWSLYLELKEDEWARYCGAITDYEFNTYWEAIP
jgi:glutamine synthetase